MFFVCFGEVKIIMMVQLNLIFIDWFLTFDIEISSCFRTLRRVPPFCICFFVLGSQELELGLRDQGVAGWVLAGESGGLGESKPQNGFGFLDVWHVLNGMFLKSGMF